MIKERDFSHRSTYPGETGNIFDVVLHRAEIIQRIPWPVFALILLAYASLIAGFNFVISATLLTFILVDWALLAALPHARISFGPPQPPILVLAVLRSLFLIFPFPIFLILQFIGTILVVYAFWIEPHRLSISHQVLKTAKIKSQKPIRLLHLGDLHIEQITRREKRLVQLVDELKPDIILFSGDVLNLSCLNDPQSWSDARAILSELHAPHGVFLVTGSPAVDVPAIMPALLKNLPLRWLQDEKITVEFEEDKLDLIGMTCTHRPHIDSSHLEDLTSGDSERFTILLYHSPDLVPAAARLGIDLQLSGHTHGGQVRLPGFGALFTGSLYGKAFESGRKQIDRLTLYVTRGIGMEGAAAPRVRFLCPPEIILWEISGCDTREKIDQGE